MRTDRNNNHVNDTANDCIAASELLAEKLIKRTELAGLTVQEAREVSGAGNAQHSAARCSGFGFASAVR